MERGGQSGPSIFTPSEHPYSLWCGVCRSDSGQPARSLDHPMPRCRHRLEGAVSPPAREADLTLLSAESILYMRYPTQASGSSVHRELAGGQPGCRRWLLWNFSLRSLVNSGSWIDCLVGSCRRLVWLRRVTRG